MKPFLVNQTSLLLERGQLRIPHKDVSEVIHRQMTNFQVVRISERTQEPSYSNTDEHGLDAMIFALYAFINDYPELVNTIYKTEVSRNAFVTKVHHPDPVANLIQQRINGRNTSNEEWDEPGSPPLKKVNIGYAGRKNETNGLGWGRRGQKTGRKPTPRGRF